MKKNLVPIFLALFSIAFFSVSDRAQATTETKVLTPIADAWIDYANPGTPHPSGNFSVINSYSPDRTANSLVKFNMDSIPSGSTINSAELGLFIDTCDPAGNGPVLTASRLISNWSESTATWNSNLHATTAGKALSNTTICARENSAIFNVKDIVQSWASGSSNYGFLISSDSTMIFSQTFFDRDNQYDLSYLNITYSSGQPTTPSGGTTGSNSNSSSNPTGTSSTSSSGSSSATANSTNGSTDTNSTNVTTENRPDDAIMNQPTSILDAFKHPSKILNWPWWKKALVALVALIIIGLIVLLIILLIKKVKRGKNGTSKNTEK